VTKVDKNIVQKLMKALVIKDIKSVTKVDENIFHQQCISLLFSREKLSQI